MNKTLEPALNQNPPEETPPQAGSFKEDVDWLSIIQFSGSALIFVIQVVILGLVAFVGAIGGTFEVMLPMMVGQAVVALLIVPSIWLSFKKIVGTSFSFTGEKLNAWADRYIPLFIVLLFPIWLLGSSAASGRGGYLVQAICNALLVLGSTAWILWFATRKLPAISAQRGWGLLTTGMTVAPWLVIGLNLVLLVVLFIILGFNLADNEWVFSELNRELIYIETFNPSIDEIVERFSSWVSLENLKWQVLFYVAVFTPIVEEFFKVIGIWLIASRVKTPAAGLRAGLLVGAGFTIVESLSAGAEPEGWAFTTAIRIVVSLMHITASGLLGWGLAKRFTKGEYWKLIFYYGGAILLHGFWNGFVINLTLDSIFTQNGDMAVILGDNFLPFIFVAFCFTLLTLFLLNFMRRRSLPAEVPQETLSQRF